MHSRPFRSSRPHGRAPCCRIRSDAQSGRRSAGHPPSPHRTPLLSLSKLTKPPLWAITATLLGLRASNSSSTRGRPCVISAGGGDTAGVEGSHGQLGTRLTDGLRRDDAHGLADGNRLAVIGKVSAVALGCRRRSSARQLMTLRIFSLGNARAYDLLCASCRSSSLPG